MKQAIPICEHLYWVGVHDFNCRHFHGNMFPIEDGATYNSYLIVDEQITVIDTVEEEFIDIMLERIQSVIGDRPVDNIIVQHGEPDHSGGFLKFMQVYPNAQPYASNAGVNIMMKQYFKDFDYKKVKTMDEICTGGYHLTFIEMPLIHWPDNMMTYVKEANILFSNDAFGQHIAGYDLFDDLHGLSKCIEKAKEYYANIVMPYGERVEKKLKEILGLQLPIKMIAPSHGVIWRTYIQELLDAYMEFATFAGKDKVVIIYESIWRHTQKMAEALAEGIGTNGVSVKVYKESITSSTLMMKEILDAKAVLIGSGCYNNDMASNISGLLAKLKTCHIKGKKALGFGSYGWFGKTVFNINEKLSEAGFTLFDEETLSINYTPSENDLNRYIEIGKHIANAIKEQ